MKFILKLLILCSLIFLLQGCAFQNLEDYSEEKPIFDLQKYFTGTTKGWGVVQDRSGTVTRRFVVEIIGSFDDNKGTLDEEFLWSNGDTQRRIWSLEKISAKNWIGFADDVIGKASGTISGNALKWEYTLKLPLDQGSVNVEFDDWMYLVDENVLINKAKFSKFGIFLGEVTLTFIKADYL